MEPDVVGATKAKENGVSKEEPEETNGAEKSSDGDDLLEDDDDWADNDDNQKLSAGIGKLVIDKDLDKSTDERLDMLEKFFIKAKEDNNIGDGKALVDEAERLDVKKKAVLVLAVTLLDQNVLKDKQLHKYQKALARFTVNDSKVGTFSFI